MIFYGAFFHINDGTNCSKKRSSQSNRTRSIVFNIHNIEINRDISIVNHNKNIINTPHEFVFSIIIKWDIKITIFQRWKIKHFINLSRHNKDTRTKSHEALRSKSFTCILIMGSQLSSTFLGIEALCFNFYSLILIIASVMCLVKATFISLASGHLASFCRNTITSEILQPSRSKSNLASLVVDSLGLGNVVGGIGTSCGLVASILVVVIVHTLLFLAISASLSHLACSWANILTFS